MLVRCGYLIGRPVAGQEEAFDRALKVEFLPRLASLPGVAEARLLVSCDSEPSAPDVYAVFAITFPDREAMERALTSDARQEMRASFARLVESFEGHVVHINSDTFAIASRNSTGGTV